jgi:3-oxoacyl-[acyl-carrier protein] reductase
VVISGGGTGIGLATAAAFVASGDQVVLLGRRSHVLEAAGERLGSAASWHAADLTEPDDVEKVATAIGSPVHVIVNNAGAGTSFDEHPTLREVAEAWRREYDVNVLTAVLLTNALLPALARPGGRVISISSVAALRGGGGAYSAAKAALHGWSLDLAGSLGADGITVNVVAPGYIAATEFFGDRMTQAGHAARVRQTLVNRAGEPNDVAAAVHYLASPQAGYVTGQILQVNGGSLLGRG